MRRECTAKGPTVEEAVLKAVEELGAERDQCEIQVMEPPKKSFFGKLKEAVVRVVWDQPDEAPVPLEEVPILRETASKGEEKAVRSEETTSVDEGKLEIARQYLQEIMNAMGLTGIRMRVEENEEGAVITFEGEGIAVLIGHHGETLDALQYLVALTCNRIDGEYYRITLDCGNYREKREATLQALAARIAAKVKKTGRSQLLEPMNPYERRIIHAVVSEIEGVYSKSKGEEPNRRVVILSDAPAKTSYHRGGGREYGNGKKSYPPRKRERTMEEILKSDQARASFAEKEESAELYSKLEL